MNRIVLCTGGFDPLHAGHIDFFAAARQLGNILVVGVNSDAWLEQKKGRAFHTHEERLLLIENLKMVDAVIEFDDALGDSSDAIRRVREFYPDDRIVFANGGDRTADTVPEVDFQDDNIEFVFGVGGQNKRNSSSWLLDEWKAPRTPRPWGYYRVLHEMPGIKVKELTVEPGQSLSLQKHQLRSEYWIVAEGRCVVEGWLTDSYRLPPKTLEKHQSVSVYASDWHQLKNPFDQPCRIVEIQYGESCDEDDIERRD